jgi:hypothetical protein
MLFPRLRALLEDHLNSQLARAGRQGRVAQLMQERS